MVNLTIRERLSRPMWEFIILDMLTYIYSKDFLGCVTNRDHEIGTSEIVLVKIIDSVSVLSRKTS